MAGYCKQGDEDCFKDKLKQSFDKFEFGGIALFEEDCFRFITGPRA